MSARRNRARLAFAIGNSSVQWAAVIDGRIRKWAASDLRVLGKDLPPDLDRIRQQWGAYERPSLAASVNPAGMRKLGSLLAEAGVPRPILAGKDFPIPIKMDVDAPEKVGVDRLLGALAAYHRTRGACITVDCGTAITVNSVSERGVFLGGAILPGFHMMARSLALNTALLPEIAFKEKVSPIGRNTEAAIAAGIFLGAAGAITRLVSEARNVIGPGAPVYLTGGGAHGEIRKYLPRGRRAYEWVPWLVVEGLVIAYRKWQKR